jgi:hypothetical protein
VTAYESLVRAPSQVSAGVTFTVRRMSFTRRTDLMRRIRELAGRMEFLEAGESPQEQMDAGLLRAEIDRVYLDWGLAGVEGLTLDGEPATPELLARIGPEELCQEALHVVRAEAGLSETERKN